MSYTAIGQSYLLFPLCNTALTVAKIFTDFCQRLNSLVIRQKDEFQNGLFQENKACQNFAKNEHFLPYDMHMYVCISGGKKCSFFGKFGMLCFLETLVLRFVLLPYYQRIGK